MKNILTKTEAEIQLRKSLPNDIIALSDVFISSGFKLFLVGGCIRDTFLGKSPKDFDVCTNALPDDVINILTKHRIKFNVQGKSFGVIVAQMESDDFEIASFRIDLNDTDDRNTNVILDGVTMEDDCKRRDFTINGLFMDLQEQNIIDLVGGIEDLNFGIVRCIGNPIDRFKEDNLRKLRAIRFSTRLGFEMDPMTFAAIHNDPTLNISGERIVNELTTIFSTAKNISELLKHLYNTKLIHEIFNGFIINEHQHITERKIISFNTFIACILRFCSKDVAKKLLASNFTVKTANSVEFLLVNSIMPIDKINPLTFIRKRRSTDLTDDEIVLFFNDTKCINWMVKFREDTSLAKKLMDDGFTGKELGEKLSESYISSFLEAIK